MWSISVESGWLKECANLRWKEEGTEAGLARVKKAGNVRSLELSDAKVIFIDGGTL